MTRKQVVVNKWFIDCKPANDVRAEQIRERIIHEGSASVIQMVLSIGGDDFTFDGVLTSGIAASNVFFASINEPSR